MADVIIVNYVDYETTKQLVNKLKNYTSIRYICVVDNNSPNGSYKYLKKAFIDNNNVKVLCTTRNGGYGYGNNYGIRYLVRTFGSDYILLCNLH